MVIVKARIKNVVSNYIYNGTSDAEALYAAMLKFEKVFGRGKFKFIGVIKVDSHPFPFINIGIRALVNLN